MIGGEVLFSLLMILSFSMEKRIKKGGIFKRQGDVINT